MRGATTELEEMGESTDGLASSTSKLRDEILALTGVDLMLDEDTFKSPYVMLQEMSKVWDKLTDVSRANVLELLGGKRQANVLSSIITNFDKAEEALATSSNSTGSALAEHAKWLDSIEAKTNQLKASWQALSKDFISSDLVKNGITILTKLAGATDDFVNAFGGLGSASLVGGIGTFIAAIKKLGIAKIANVAEEFAISGIAGGIKKTFSTLGEAMSSSFVGAASSALLVFSALSLILNLVKKYKQAQREENEELRKTGDDALKSSQNIRSLQQAYESTQSAYRNGTGSKEAYDAATKELLSSLGYEESQIDSLITKHGSLEEAIRKETAAKEESNRTAMIAGIGAAERLLEEDNEHAVKVSGENKRDIIKLLRENGYDYGFTGSGDERGLILSSDARVAYEQLQDIQKLLEETYGEEARSYEFFNQVNKELEKRKDHYESLTAQQKEYVSGIAKDAKDAFESSFGDIDSQEEFEKMFESVAEKLNASDIFKKSGIDADSFLSEYFGNIAEYSDYATEHIEANARSAARFVELVFGGKENNAKELIAKGILSGGEHASEILPWISELEEADKNLVFDIIINTPDSAMWNLDQLKSKFDGIKNTTDVAIDSLAAFNSLMADTGDASFTKAIGASQDRISKLLDARANMGKYQDMDARFELITDFPELAPYIDDTNALYDALTDLIDATYEGIDSRFEEEIANLGGAATESGAALASLQQMFHDVKHDYGIEGYSESSNQLAAVNTAVSNGFSGTGMKPEDIQAIISAYGKLDSYDPAVLFERTAQGVQVNTKALAILNKELVNSQKTGYRKYLQSLNQEYADLQGKLQSAHSAEEDSQWKARLGEIEQLTRAVADEAAAYDGLTSSFQAWQDAQKTGDQQDNYVSVYKGLEQTQALIDAGWGGNDDVLSYINHFLSAEEQVTSWGEVTEETWANITNTIGRYYGETAENLDTFLQDAMQAQGSMEWIKQLEDGSYEIDMDLGDIEQLATLMNENLDGVQISAENIQEIFNALKGSGAEITFSSDLDEPLQKTQGIIDNIDEAKERSAEKTAYNLYADKAKKDTSGVLSNIREAIKEAQREKTVNLDTGAAMNRLQELNNYLKSIKTDIRVNVYTGTVISNASNGVNAPGRDGPVYANGTAFARGSWGAKGSGIALGGELGREIVVRDGEWFTIGDNGAEFFRYQPDDIIFNAMQTQELLKYGGTRGRGESFASGTAFYTGVKGNYTAPKVKKKDNSKSSSKSSRSSSNNRSSNSRSSNSSTDKEFSETFDWIEVKIARIERAISNLDTKTNSVYRKWSKRNSYLSEEISKVNSEIDIQSKGYDRYIKEANSVGLSKKYRNKVKSGKIDIETIKNEKLADKIKLYQQWYVHATLYSNVY